MTLPPGDIVCSMDTQEATNRIKDWQERATEAARKASQQTDSYVRENTWAAIGIAALVGCVLGYLLSNRD